MTRPSKILFILSFFVIGIFGIVIYRQLPTGDYQHHLEWAKEIAQNGYTIHLPHVLFQKLVVITRILIPFRDFALLNPRFREIIDSRSYDIATMVLMMAALVITSWVIFRRFNDIWQDNNQILKPWTGAMLTLVAMLVGPIFFFTFPDRTYLGYITGNVYHNPTILLLRPLALLIFGITLRELYGRSSWKIVISTGILIILATHAKPSFTITFLPALALLGLMRYRSLKLLNWRYIILGLGVPAILVLLEQFMVSYAGATSDRIVFAPFEAILQYVPNVGTSLWFIFLSILFPLAATVFYWSKFSKNLGIKLAWLNFGVGLIIALLFTEVINKPSLNFWWGPMVGLFILFIESLGNAVSQGMFNFKDGKKLAVKISLTVILASHLTCGIIYYLNSTLYPAPII